MKPPVIRLPVAVPAIGIALLLRRDYSCANGRIVELMRGLVNIVLLFVRYLTIVTPYSVTPAAKGQTLMGTRSKESDRGQRTNLIAGAG